MYSRSRSKSLVLAAMFLSLGLILPFLTGQIPAINQHFCLMHIPILLCGLICGWRWGGIIGFITPLLRSVLFGIPVMFPNAISMAFELMTYGSMIGFLYRTIHRQTISAVYFSLIPAMITGRIVWGSVRLFMAGVSGTSFTWSLFLSGALINAIPGIILQLVFIPSIIYALNRSGYFSVSF